MASHRLGLIKRLGLALTLAQPLIFNADGPAQAQFFQPFGYSYDAPPVDDERPRFATPRAVSRILARRGFELASGLGRRGDQVVVTGVSRREGAVRFFIDPYEGEVIHAIRLGPPPADAPPAFGEPPFAGRRESPRPPVGSDVAVGPPRQGLEPPPVGSRPTRRVQPSAKAAPPPSDPAATSAAPQSGTKPPEATKPIEWAKPAEIAKPAEPVKASEPAKPAATAAAPENPPVDAKASEPKSASPASPRPGVPGRRAIVAPGTAGDTAATTSR